MANESRVRKSAKNMASGMAYRFLTIITAFIVRTVFIKCLNNVYLSVNGLYSSILSMLSLAELGFSTAMVYSMYKPLADGDNKKLSQIMHLYKRVYRYIGLFILIVGLCLVPFLDIFIKNKPDISNLTFYYILFLVDAVLSYWFFAYRTSILQADQKAYIISNYSSIFNLIKAVLQIAGLLWFHNFTLYLLTQMGCTILQNIVIAIRVNKEYPIFDRGNKEELPKEEKQHIFRDVKALMLQKVSFKVLNTTDSLIISAFVGINWVGLLSNYLMIQDAVVAVLSQITSSVSASLGNFFAKEDKESGYILFKRIEFLNFWLYGFSAIAFAVLLNPFVELWLGREYVLSEFVVIAIVIRFFVEGYMNMMSTFRSTLGLFTQGQYIPLIVAAINVFLSIGLSFPFGVAGVIIATPLARCCINVWYMPLIIHRDGFKKPVASFYKRYLLRMLLLFVVMFGMTMFSQRVIISNGVTVVNFIVTVLFTAIVPNIIFAMAFFKTKEFKYFFEMFKSVFELLKKSL